MIRTKNAKRAEYATRDSIMKLLSDGEVGSISNAETNTHLSNGDEYLDLEQLDQGVQRATATKTPMGPVLSRKAVREKTWSKIVRQLVVSGNSMAATGR